MTYNIEAIIFDFDGVFVDSFNCIFNAYNHMREKMGLEKFKTIEEFKGFYSVNFDKNYEKMGFYGEEKKKAYSYVQEYITANYINAPFFEDLISTIKCINLPFGIASSGESSFIIEKLKRKGIENLFKSIIGYEHVTSIKPSAEPLLLCAKNMGIDIKSAAYVGDTVVDIIAGRNANAKKVIAVSWGFDDIEKLRQANPDVILMHPKELLLHIQNGA